MDQDARFLPAPGMKSWRSSCFIRRRYLYESGFTNPWSTTRQEHGALRPLRQEQKIATQLGQALMYRGFKLGIMIFK